MKIKIFEANCDGKIELTKSELQSLIDEAYEEGRNDSMTYIWGRPNFTPTIDDSKITYPDLAIFGSSSNSIMKNYCDYSTTTIASANLQNE